MKRGIFIFSTVCLFSFSLCCFAGAEKLRCRTIYDFESRDELSGLYYRCHTWFDIDTRHATSGKRSLRLEMYPPETYPGLSIKDLKGPWRDVEEIRLDIFNPGQKEISVTFRIDDREDGPPYADRVNKRVSLRPGLNHVVLDLKNLLTSGTRRHLLPERICSFMFFLVSPSRPVTIFVDNIRLCKEK